MDIEGGSESAGKGGSVVISLSNITLLQSLSCSSSSHSFSPPLFLLTSPLMFTVSAQTPLSSLIQLNSPFNKLSFCPPQPPSRFTPLLPLLSGPSPPFLPPPFNFPSLPPSLNSSISFFFLFFHSAFSPQSIQPSIHPSDIMCL